MQIDVWLTLLILTCAVELQILGIRATDDSTEVFFQVLNADGAKEIRDGSIVLATA